MTDINQVKNAILRKSFSSFVQKCFYELNPSEAFIKGAYIDLLCDQIQNMIEGKNQKLIINLPPRYLKSVICSIALPAFILGHNPSTKIMCISYGEELASKLAADCKSVMEADWYKALFPETKIRTDKKSVMDFETTKHGGRFATTISGAVTGRGADWIIIDDPLKPADALSDVVREKINELYGNTVSSRLNDKNTGRILVVMQRLHAHDLSGFLFENDPDFKSIVLPLIAEKDEKWQIKNRIAKTITTYERKKGELLHPEREGEKVVNSYRNSMSPFVFSAQYQQNPMPIGSGMIKQEWMKYYQALPSRLDKIILSWDTAAKAMENNAYSACAVVGIGNENGQKYYLIEVFRGRLNFPELTKKVQEISDKYERIAQGRTITLIEDASSGTSLYQTLKGSRPKWGTAILAAENVNLSKIELKYSTAYPGSMTVFVQFLKENAAMFNSDFAFADNYQFKKKDADTLVLTVGDIEYTFLKKGKNSADVIVVKDVDQWGSQIINKSTILNNSLY